MAQATNGSAEARKGKAGQHRSWRIGILIGETMAKLSIRPLITLAKKHGFCDGGENAGTIWTPCSNEISHGYVISAGRENSRALLVRLEQLVKADSRFLVKRWTTTRFDAIQFEVTRVR
jgi:hypothetical protein